jgi:hypothetical protein
MKNPFAILGISPEMCSRLNDEDLFVLVRSAYRALQTIYHPDRGGSHKKAIEVNLAFEMLDYRKDQEQFAAHKERYIKRLYRTVRGRAQELTGQLEQQQRVCHQTAVNYYDYILSGLGCTEHEHSIAALTSVTIGLYDLALQQNLPRALPGAGTNYKKIRIDKQGRSFVREVGSPRFYERKSTRLLGTIPRDALDILPHLRGYETTPHVPFNLRSEKKLLGYQKPVFKNMILEENFVTYCLQHLVPFIREQSYLISLNTRDRKLLLDGVVIKISRGDAAAQ